ncbi:hypothetical protein ABPG74_008877 [Tetrahymena malaccensis]
MFPTAIDISQIQQDSHRSAQSTLLQAQEKIISNRTPSKRLENDSPAAISSTSASKSTFSVLHTQNQLHTQRPKVIFHHIHETDYTLESHLKNIIKPKPENTEKIREAQIKKEMIQYLQNTKLESPLKSKSVKDKFFSKQSRQKRSEERQETYQKTLQRLFRSQMNTSCSTKYSKSANTYTTLKSDSVMVPDDQHTQAHLSQFSCITPKKTLFNEHVDYWDYDGFYDQFQYNQSSMKRSILRQRQNPLDNSMNNTSYLKDKKIRNGSLIAQKQQQINVLKLARPVSNEAQILRQHIMHPKIDHILEKYNFSKAAPTKKGGLNESQLAKNIDLNDLSQKFLKSQLIQQEQSEYRGRLKSKVHKLVRKENDIYSPHKVPDYQNFKQDFYELNCRNIKNAFNNFKEYQTKEFDTFYNVKAKNPYLKVYCDGQQKLVNMYLEQSDLEERVFYQYDHDPFINDPKTYEIFDIVGRSYMKQVPPHPYQHKRRYAKNEQQLERELNKTQQIYQQSIKENTDKSDQTIELSSPQSPLSLRAYSSYVN